MDRLQVSFKPICWWMDRTLLIPKGGDDTYRKRLRRILFELFAVVRKMGW